MNTPSNNPARTIASRLADRQREFLEGSPDLSDRDARKKAATDAVEQRSEAFRCFLNSVAEREEVYRRLAD